MRTASRKRTLSALCGMLMIILLLLGCQKAGEKSALTLNSDGTVGGVTWGMTLTEAQKALGSAAVLGEDGNTLHIKALSLLGTDVSVKFDFGKAGLDLPEERLCAITITFPQTAVQAVLEEKITGVLGARETQGVMRSGETYELTKENYYWHASRSLNEALNDKGKSAAFPLAASSLSPVMEMDDDTFAWWLSTHWLYTARLVENPRSGSLALYIDGSADMWTTVLNDA